MRVLRVLLLAVTVAAPLGACGKQGPLRLPMTGLSHAQLSNGVAE